MCNVQNGEKHFVQIFHVKWKFEIEKLEDIVFFLVVNKKILFTSSINITFEEKHKIYGAIIVICQCNYVFKVEFNKGNSWKGSLNVETSVSKQFGFRCWFSLVIDH